MQAGNYKGPTWHGLISCGPGGPVGYETDPGSPLSGNVEWQCVELVERWLHQEFHFPQVVFVPGDSRPTDGWLVVAHYLKYMQLHKATNYPFRRVTPDTAKPGSLGPGDVISFGNVAPGHTDVVEQAQVGDKGNGHILTLNQNLPLPCGKSGCPPAGPIEKKIDLKRWHFQIYGLPPTGWLHYTGGTASKQFVKCDPVSPFPNPPFAAGVGCDHARDVVRTWNQLTAGTCGLNGSACQVLDFTCQVPGPNFSKLVCNRPDGAEIRMEIGPY